MHFLSSHTIFYSGRGATVFTQKDAKTPEWKLWVAKHHFCLPEELHSFFFLFFPKAKKSYFMTTL